MNRWNRGETLWAAIMAAFAGQAGPDFHLPWNPASRRFSSDFQGTGRSRRKGLTLGCGRIAVADSVCCTIGDHEAQTL